MKKKPTRRDQKQYLSDNIEKAKQKSGEKAAILLVIILGLCCIILMTGLVYTIKLCDKCSYCEMLTKYSERMEMYNESLKIETRVNGVYHSPNYYCVWTKGRSAEEIKRTDCHESCHHFVEIDNKHFCGGVGW